MIPSQSKRKTSSSNRVKNEFFQKHREMKRVLILAVMAMALSACGEVKEELWVNENNEMKLDLTWDMAKEPSTGGFSMSSLLTKLGSYMPSSINETVMKRAFEQMGVPYDGQTYIDSTIYFDKISDLNYETLLKSIEEADEKHVLSSAEQKELAQAVVNSTKGGYARCHIDCSQNIYLAEGHTGWIKVEDYNTMSEGLYKLDNAYNLDLHNVFDGCGRIMLYSVYNEGFTRGSCDWAHLIDVNGSGPFASNSKVGYIFGDGKSYEMLSIFHLPKPVASMSNSKATLSDGNKTVTLRLTASDMNSGKTPQNVIKY